MAAKKPPPLPPDTAQGGGDPPLSVSPNAGERNNTENPESIVPAEPEIRRVDISTVVPHEPHQVLFTVFKDGNAIRFLSELLTNLLLVDSTSKILPTSVAQDAYPELDRNTAFPTNATDAKKFAKAYLADLKVSSKGDMKGKVLIRTKARFPTLKKNRNFRSWLDGSTIAPIRPKVLLVKTELEGSIRVSAGFFLNVVPRHDMVMNFHTQLAKSLFSTLQASGAYPDFQIEVYSLHGNGGNKARVYRMLTSSVSNVRILSEKMAVIMPKPSTDISYIPQKAWDSLLATKKNDYVTMQCVFESNHNSRLLVGLKNAKMLLAKATAAGTNSGSAQGISIFTWLTRVKAADGCTMFPKVFECVEGDIELWYHVTHDLEVRAWMSTALAEVARMSGMTLENDRARAEAMFKNPEKVWTHLDRMNTGVPSLTAQRSVYMDFSPPTGIITFPNRKSVQGRQRRGKSDVKLVFDIDAATTVSVLTPDTRSRASSRSRRRNNKNPAVGTVGPSSSTTNTNAEDDGGKAAAVDAAKVAIQVADAALSKYPPKTKTAHQGAYDTVSDKFGNKLPVVAIDGKWVPLTEATLLESRKKAPPMNYGLVARITIQTADVAPTNTMYQQTRQQPRTIGQGTEIATAIVVPAVVGAIDPTATHGFVRTQATTINARTEADVGVRLAPATVFGTSEDFPPLVVRADTTSAAMEIVYGDETHHSSDVDMDEHEERDEEESGNGSANSYGGKSTTSDTTAGQSVVTFAQMATRQAYVITETNDALMHHTESVAEPTKKDGPTQLVKLESTTKKAAKKSSLQAAAIQGAIDRRAAKTAAGTNIEGPKQPVLGPPPRDVSGRFIEERAGLPSSMSAEEREAIIGRAKVDFQRRKLASSTMVAETAADARMEQMEVQMQRMQQLVEENARLNSLVHLLIKKNGMDGTLDAATVPRTLVQEIQASMCVPREHIDAIGKVPQVSTEMVEWSPLRERRRSKKTPLEAELPVRTPPRPPQGTPQTKKKHRVSASPAPTANRYAPLADEYIDDVPDEEMDEETEECLADVEERLDNLKIRHTHVQLDSFKKKGASGNE